MKKLIVFDSNHPLAVNNRCFDPIYADQGSGYFFWSALNNEAAKNNIKCVTGDIFLSQPLNKNEKAFSVSEMHTSNTNNILKKGAVPAICFSLESPLIARNFYHSIEKYSGRFLHSFQFGGTKSRLEKTKTKFHTIHFPVNSRTVKKGISWNEKKYLVIINSNKRAAHVNYGGIKNSIRSLASQLKFSALKLIDPWMRIREIYLDRIVAIEYFSAHDDFFLFGNGWDDNISGFGNEFTKAVKKAWKGPLGTETETKLNTMHQFKFSICFENCNFPGYITEKIFDSFLSGCIPVYYGAPDITNFIPEETFIDYRKFKSMGELDSYLKNMREEKAQGYLKAAKNFLSSTAFDKFHVNNIVGEMVKNITDT